MQRIATGADARRPPGGIISDFWKLTQMPVKLLVLDECQKIKRENGSTFRAVQSIFRRATLLLSGTILDNRWYDVANALAMLQGHPFETRAKFLKTISLGKDDTKRQNEEPDIVSLTQFLMACVVARPSRCLILPGLTLVDVRFEVNTSEFERINDATLKYEHARTAIEAGCNYTPEHQKALGFAVIAQLLAAHSLLAPGANDHPATPTTQIDEPPDDIVVQLCQMEETPSGTQSRKDWLRKLEGTDIDVLGDSSRVRVLIQLLRHIDRKYPREKVIIFSTFLKFLDIISRVVKSELGQECLHYNGTMDATIKTHVQNEFTQGSTKYMLITSGSGGIGLNLQAASIVVQAEPWWNRNLERQSYARCWRQGQDRVVKVFRLVASNSPIDIAIKACQARKDVVNNSVLEVIVKKDEESLRILDYPS